MVNGSKSADSIRTCVVPGAISESSPPITPATAEGFSASQMRSIFSSSLRSCPSSVFIVSFARAARTTILRPASLV